MKNQRGQASIEMVLMVALAVMVAMAVSKGLRDNEFFATLVSGPWTSITGLVQNGTWGSPEDTMAKHPNQFVRVSTVEGDDVE